MYTAVVGTVEHCIYVHVGDAITHIQRRKNKWEWKSGLEDWERQKK